MLESVAVTVSEPLASGALYRPLVLTNPPAPPAASVQVKAGWMAIARPNWSRALAVNCRVAPQSRLTVAGLTLMLVSVWFTVTVTLLSAVR